MTKGVKNGWLVREESGRAGGGEQMLTMKSGRMETVPITFAPGSRGWCDAASSFLWPESTRACT